MSRVTHPRHIVLDLDGTLIGEDYICARPYLADFLAFCFDHFDTVNIWTAASRHWWDQCYDKFIKKRMPKDKQFTLVWCGDRCKNKRDLDFAVTFRYKPLSKYWRRKSSTMTKFNTVVVDNDPTTYMANRGNAIPVETYLGSSKDIGLQQVMNVLVAKIYYSLSHDLDVSPIL